MIEFERVSRRFGDLDALRHLNLTIDQGEMAFITGHSGAGKSTLLRLLLLLDRPSSGEIRVKGELTRAIRSHRVPQLSASLWRGFSGSPITVSIAVSMTMSRCRW